MDAAASLNSAIHEEVRLCSYEPEWPALFEDERRRLLSLFPDDLRVIEHIGSTAVPGLSAKPIIDIVAGVDSMERADALLEPLCRAEYATSMAYNASLSDRRWLMRWAKGRRTHHLHLMVTGSSQWQQRLAFRDLLRNNAKLARQYEACKQRWASEYRLDREAYTAAKSEFIQEALG